MRGKLRGHLATVKQNGITPAHAGKTAVLVNSCGSEKDHPRACGENLWSKTPAAAIQGSPPRMRGKLPLLIEGIVKGRITPAHAGKTGVCVTFPIIYKDHPRACGENLNQRIYIFHCYGSPPRMRGKRIPYNASVFIARITPAHAGKTAIVADVSARRQDHPRACGENLDNAVCARYRGGSPPRMRGKRCAGMQDKAQHGITPAHAGKTRGHTAGL